jgi:23S rRNA (cytosine1962-C5)-methyltransferase
MSFRAPADFETDHILALRQAVMDSQETNAYRLIHGASDNWPGWYLDRLGEFLLSQCDMALTEEQRRHVATLMQLTGTRGAYHKRLTRHLRQTKVAETSPEWLLGDMALRPFLVKENGVQFELSFAEGYSVGLFLDQRENRRRFLVNHVAADFPLFPGAPSDREVLNTFCYTCGFSVCAGIAGARTTSLDLSKKYLDWGKRNVALNGLDSAKHDFIYGDVFEWMARFAKKQRRFDAIILDPPTFSQSKSTGAFRVEKDYPALMGLALPLVKPGGVLLACTNSAKWLPEAFVECVKSSVAKAKRKALQMYYAPQPMDFPVSRPEPAYLKTLWLRIE